MSLNEADTCRVYVTPRLREAGWEEPPHLIAEQHTFTDGRIKIVAGKAVRADRVAEGDLVISNIKAWEGAIAVAASNDHDRVASHRYMTCVARREVVVPDFVCFYLLTNEGITHVQAASPGSADRNRTLAMRRLEQIPVPVPPFSRQREFSTLQAKVAAIRRARADNPPELDALLPAVLDKAFKGEL
jgi:type I restriction enzyme, S subunit